MSELIRIAKGLKATYKNARDYSIPQALLEIEKYTDNYEVLNADINRIYGDIDGKGIETSESEFNELDRKTKDAIVSFLKDERYSLMTASSFLHKKISWRFVLTNRKTSAEDNKKWVQASIEQIALPEGITFDTSPYGKNQKIRMVGSNKDGENRPLRLIVGDVLDTLISYMPAECVLMELPKEKKTKPKKKSEESKMSEKLLTRLVMNIRNDETTDWEQWYKVAQAVFNEGGTEELFLAWSSKSSKHNEREASLQWKSLKQGSGLTAGSLYFWSQQSNPEEHEKIIVECCDPDDYHYQKIVFERTHFKLMNPPTYVRQAGEQLQFIKDGDLMLLYQNQFFGDKLFISLWKADPDIRTYEEIVFKPKQEVPANQFNIFSDFSCKAVQGDCSVMNELMWSLSGKETHVFEYLENYFAHLIQRPYDKCGVCLVFVTTKEGAGKDTPLDFIGNRILGGEYYFNTEDAENQVFGRFTSHLQKTLLVKLEEAEFETNKKNASALMNWITSPKHTYEGKGREPITLDDYKRFVMSSNKTIPVNVPESNRRFVLINSSEDRVGDREYWNRVHKELAKPETAQAYFHYLLHKDISQFEVRNRPETEYYREVRRMLRPYHASYFQKWLSLNGDDTEECEMSATDLLTRMNENSKFVMNPTKLGVDLKAYPDSAITKKKGRYSNSYVLHTKELHAFLVAKGWWSE